MANSVSRRLVFVKMKRRRPLPKPRAPVADNGKMVGEAARLAPAPVWVPRSVPPKRRQVPWRLIATGAAGLLAVAATVVLLVGMDQRPMDTVQSSYGSLPTHPGYSRSGASGGYQGGGGSSGGTASSADRFLASNLRKPKPTSCSARIGGGEDSRREFSKCLEQASEATPEPGRTRE